MTRVAINGLGSGRAFLEAARTRPELEVVAVNDVADPVSLAYLLRSDSVQGRYAPPVAIEADGTPTLVIGHHRIRLLQHGHPEPRGLAGTGSRPATGAGGRGQHRAGIDRRRDRAHARHTRADRALRRDRDAGAGGRRPAVGHQLPRRPARDGRGDQRGTRGRVHSWYDNEAGYAHVLLQHVLAAGRHVAPTSPRPAEPDRATGTRHTAPNVTRP
jgi:hypothetical protein